MIIRVRKYKTTRAALPRLAERKRHSALGSGLCLPKASMAQSDASDETEIAWRCTPQQASSQDVQGV